jgi:hypothetical protein
MGGRNVLKAGAFEGAEATVMADLGTLLLTDEPVCEVAPDAHQYRCVNLGVRYAVRPRRASGLPPTAERSATGRLTRGPRRGQG